MRQLQKRYAEGLPIHHAFHLVGDQTVCEQAVLTFIESDLNVAVHGNPDVMVMRYVSLAVADARQLKEFASKKALRDSHYFVISFQFATTEAQNALLKLLEEPTRGTHFFIITPAYGTLLPTLRSRVERLRVVSEIQQSSRAVSFLAGSPKQRQVLLKDIVEEKNKEELLRLVGELEERFQDTLRDTPSIEWRQSAEALLAARRYLHGKSASVKMIGEYLAAVLPKA